MSLIFQRNSRLVEGNFQQANTPSPTTVLHNLWLPSFVIYGQTFGFPGCCKLKRIFHHTRLNLLLFLIYVYPRRWNRMRWRAFRKICGETWVAALSSGERRKKTHTGPRPDVGFADVGFLERRSIFPVWKLLRRKNLISGENRGDIAKENGWKIKVKNRFT